MPVTDPGVAAHSPPGAPTWQRAPYAPFPREPERLWSASWSYYSTMSHTYRCYGCKLASFSRERIPKLRHTLEWRRLVLGGDKGRQILFPP